MSSRPPTVEAWVIMLEKLKSRIFAVDDLVCLLGNICIVLNMAFVVVNVVLRSVFNMPVVGFNDISGMVSCLIVALTIAYTEKENGHINVDFIVAYFPAVMQKALFIVMGVLNAAITGVLGVFFFDYGLSTLKSGSVTMTAKIPFAPFIFVCSLGMILLTVTVLVKTFTHPIKTQGGDV